MSVLSFVGDLANAAQSAINSVANGLNARWMMKKQNQLNRQMMDEMNEYNSPRNQMLRLMDAGLNPNLAYGSISTGNQSSPTQQGVPDYSEAIQSASDVASNAGKALRHAYEDKMLRKQIELQEKNLELQGKRVDNAIQQTDIKRAMSELAIKKGDYQMASMFLDNRFKAMTLYDRVKAERWRQELLGYKTDTARAEAAYAPDFYDLRNQQARKNIWYLGQKAALGWSDLSFKKSKWNDEKKYLSHKETWSAYAKYELIKATKERIRLQEELVKTAKTAEERKQREQTLHYLFKALEDISAGTMRATELLIGL